MSTFKPTVVVEKDIPIEARNKLKIESHFMLVLEILLSSPSSSGEYFTDQCFNSSHFKQIFW